MNESTSLIRKKGHTSSPSLMNEKEEFKPLWKLQASALGLLAIIGSYLLLSNPSLAPLHEPTRETLDLSTEEETFQLSLDQRIQVVEYWKDFLSWNDVWDHVKATWNQAQDKAQDAWEQAKEQNISDHTRVWANQTVEQGKTWWDHAQDYYNNLTDAISSQSNPSDHKSKKLDLIYMNQSRAFYLLLSKGDEGPFDYSSDYFLLNQGLDAQINQAYCAVATSVAVLNSLRGLIDLPEDPVYHPYPYATQRDVFNECTDSNVIVHNTTFDGILSSPYGLNLDSTSALLQCHLPEDEWDIETVHVNASMTPDDLREDLKDALLNPDARVLINYHRAVAGQIGGGHFSPLGAYSPVLDAFLIMDVAKYKYPPAWIPTERLYQALAALDHCGIWDGPAKQASLPPGLLHPNSITELQGIMKLLGCQTSPRGYIVVSKK